MTSADLADTVNAEDRYRKKDGSAVTSSQISARVSTYPRIFERVDDPRIGLRRPTDDGSPTPTNTYATETPLNADSAALRGTASKKRSLPPKTCSTASAAAGLHPGFVLTASD